MAAGRRIEAVDQMVAAEQVVLSGQVVDVALMAIDPIHQLRAGRASLLMISSANT